MEVDHDLVVKQSGCVICMEDQDPDELEPPVTSEERRLFGGVDGTSICMYSLLHSRFVAGTYAREVVAVHDVVPGTRVPRCWLHKDNHDEWLSFLYSVHETGLTGLCPVCNRGALLDYQNKVMVFDKENMNEPVLCGLGRNVTPLYVAVEADRNVVVAHLLVQPHLQVDATSEVDGHERTPLRCAAEQGNWKVVQQLLNGNARDDLWVTHALEMHLDNAAVARMTGPELVRTWLDFIYKQDITKPGIIVLAARAHAWDTVLQIVSRIHTNFGDWNELSSLLQRSDGESVFVMAVRYEQWAVVNAMLYTWQIFNTRQGGKDVFSVRCKFTQSQQKYLVKGAAEVLLAADKDGTTALEHAGAAGMWNAVSILMSCNAYVNPRQCQATQELLLSAAQVYQWNVVKQMLRFPNIVQRMQFGTIDQDIINQNVLWLACENKGWSIVGRLVGAVGVHPNIPNFHGTSPLWLAASQCAWDEMRLMLTFVKRADMQRARDLRTTHVNEIQSARQRLGPTFASHPNGNSLVTMVASKCKWDIVWRLLNEFYVDPNTIDACGRSLLEIVITAHEWPLAAFLHDATWRNMPVDTDMSFLATYAAAHHQWVLVVAMMKHGPLIRTDAGNALYRSSINMGVWSVVFWGLHRDVGEACDWMVREALERKQYWILEFLYRHGARRSTVEHSFPPLVPLDTELPDEEIRTILQGMGLA